MDLREKIWRDLLGLTFDGVLDSQVGADKILSTVKKELLKKIDMKLINEKLPDYKVSLILTHNNALKEVKQIIEEL